MGFHRTWIFLFDFQTIDRPYYINTNEANHDRTYELLCRTCYKGKYYFVGMYAYCDDKGFENDRGGGYLTITKTNERPKGYLRLVF